MDEGGEEESEMYCWKDDTRSCGEDCVAFDVRSLDDSLWNPCLLLNLKRAKAKSLANIATELKRQNDFYEKADEDMLRRLEKRRESEAYAAKVKEMDAPPPEVKT
jgi:hypothetical protein